MVMRKAKDAGVHVAMGYITQTLGYADPQPIEPEDERARLQREFITAVKALDTIQNRMNTLQAVA